MLRSLEEKDKKGMLEWMLDSEVIKNFRFDSENVTLEAATEV